MPWRPPRHPELAHVLAAVWLDGSPVTWDSVDPTGLSIDAALELGRPSVLAGIPRTERDALLEQLQCRASISAASHRAIAISH